MAIQRELWAEMIAELINNKIFTESAGVQSVRNKVNTCLAKYFF